jgi:hypothetical protein
MAEVCYKENFDCVDKVGDARWIRIWELQTYRAKRKRMAKICCKEDFEASKDTISCQNCTFCFKIHVEKDGSNADMNTLYFHVLSVIFSCVLRIKIKDMHYFHHPVYSLMSVLHIWGQSPLSYHTRIC